MSQVKNLGVKVRVGSLDLIVPALSMKQARQFKPLIEKFPEFITRNPTDEEEAETVKLIHAAITRNYPDLTLDQFEDELDLNALPLLTQAVLGTSKEEKTLGEAGTGAV
jgi:hypothetical protein